MDIDKWIHQSRLNDTDHRLSMDFVHMDLLKNTRRFIESTIIYKN